MRKVLSASGTLNQISSLKGQIDGLRLTASQANERLGRGVNVADVSLTTHDECLPCTLTGAPLSKSLQAVWHSYSHMVQALYSSFFQTAYDGLVTNIRSYLYQAYQVPHPCCEWPHQLLTMHKEVSLGCDTAQFNQACGHTQLLTLRAHALHPWMAITDMCKAISSTHSAV